MVLGCNFGRPYHRNMYKNLSHIPHQVYNTGPQQFRSLSQLRIADLSLRNAKATHLQLSTKLLHPPLD
jgi:hypothetical protein